MALIPRLRISKEAKKILAMGIRNRWYGIFPSNFVKEGPLALKRWGQDLVAWRDKAGKLYLQEDRCPHRGAPLSLARHDGDRLTCIYHGFEILGDGVVATVPSVQDSKLEGRCLVRTYPTKEFNGVVFAWYGDELHQDPAPFNLPERLVSNEYEAILSYGEWRTPYRYMIDNNMDPMHGAYLHAVSHSMAAGSKDAKFEVVATKHGLRFQKQGQENINFDWSEWYDNGFQGICLEIPYPSTGGPGGNFGIVFHITPIDEMTSACFFWRHRKVSGWVADVWRFLYSNRLEERHWHVLEQDRLVAERMGLDADKYEHLNEHDLGLIQVRKLLAEEAESQVQALKQAGHLN
jgi:phenylpropionate dioxygenase-like ring-hydroxylating dioxygenase large terminal subunit